MCACFVEVQKGGVIRFFLTFFILFGIGRGAGGRTRWGSGGRNHLKKEDSMEAKCPFFVL
jgi:hypothetical protein